jgi:O-antigen/teichoic acid export membrane protein
MLASAGSPVAIAYYGLVSRIVNIPNSFVSSTVRPVFFHFATRHSTLDAEDSVCLVVRTLGLCSVLIWATAVHGLETAIAILFGPDWIPAAPYAYALSIPAIPLLMGNWADRLFDVLNRQRSALILELIVSVAAMGGLAAGYFAFHDLLVGIWIQSILLMIFYLAWLVVLFRAAGYSVRRLLIIFAEVLCVAAVMWSLTFLLRKAIPDQLAVAVSVAFALALAGALCVSAYKKLKRLQVIATSREAIK